MKWVGFTLAILWLQIPLVRAAEYQGKTIDGRTFPAQVYSYETGAVCEAQVQFNKDRATIEFPAGGRFIARLQHAVITDPARIEASGSPGRIPLGSSFILVSMASVPVILYPLILRIHWPTWGA